MDANPVFYDATGRRRRQFTLAVIAFVALVLLAGTLFAATIIATTPSPSLPFQVERAGDTQPNAIERGARRLERSIVRRGKWLLNGRPARQTALTVAFHAPWDSSSAASLQRHVEDLDWVVPGWVSITGPDHHWTVFDDRAGRQILSRAVHRPKILPMVQNALNGNWDSAGAAAMLRSPLARKAMLDRLEQFLQTNKADGAFFDIENLPPSSQRDYQVFLREVHARFAPHGWLMAMAVPVGDPAWRLPVYAALVDRMFLMAYDEHDPDGDPGPIASQAWFASTLAADLKGLPLDKVVVAIGSYAYNWTKGEHPADTPSLEEAMLVAHDSGTMPRFDPVSGNLTFSYEEGGKEHELWMLDAASFHNQMLAARAAGVSAVALWRLGTEDPSVWQIFGRSHRAGADVRTIENIPPGTDVDIEGTGEVLRVGSTPVAGHRKLTIAGNGLVTNEEFTQLPLPFSIERAGYKPGLVALTFDDGPDPDWTPKILDILKAKQVPATFFIVGENALTYRDLLEREVREGHEIGNHTYTHPNLGQTSDTVTRIEVNAVERLVQAFTGRAIRLFRAPFFGDAEPTTADEIVPVQIAQDLGYLSVGLHVDPGDWKRPGVPAIVNGTISGVLASNEDRSGNIVLLHDAGGNRDQTVQALPIIIDQLRARGYRFVPVSGLVGLTRAQVMPPLTPEERAAARTDLYLFTALGALQTTLKWLFGIAITLGIARAVMLSGLAVWQARREQTEEAPAIQADRFVSVLIPAFNEARVIETSVRRVLQSVAVKLEVIVIDDGSKDGTGDIVERAFGDEPRVKLLRLENGGKARALNQALAVAGGEFIVALDADTQFPKKTIARLVRWFEDERIGAVAGNAKVGNRVNLVTRWQALEYITAQNLERRALARLDAMTVVPGAVGAWRAEALRQVGGYPPDTLAEDQDLTIAIQRAGWKVRYDQDAVAFTEAPESFRALAKQRFRWAYGTLQCLWKHGGPVLRSGKPRGLALVGLPQAALFQVGFAAISPVIDLALIFSIISTVMRVQAHGWAQTHTDLVVMGAYWLAFTAIDVLAAAIAFALSTRERWGLMWLLIPQRIGYRQIMYYVVLKALAAAIRGPRVGWGKLERSGRVKAA
ncbi:polysaccharide deacetylase family protein [Sphingomonas tabacisoli]|uniref:Chitooligosaccharide deacetylase n=1 Tax=Sphingomonas tabacisoli TaxID=2249466 RepID=A0ABW4HZT8_9SPHN